MPTRDLTLHSLHSSTERDSVHCTPPAKDDKPTYSATTVGLTARGPFSTTEVIERDMLNKHKPQYPAPPHSLPPHWSHTQFNPALANGDHPPFQGDSVVPRGAYSQQQQGSYKSLNGSAAPSLPPGNVHSSHSSQPLPPPSVFTQPNAQPVPMGTGQGRIGSGLGQAALAPPTLGPEVQGQRFHPHQPPYHPHYSGSYEGGANWRVDERTHSGYPLTHHHPPPQRSTLQQNRLTGHAGATAQDQRNLPSHYMGSQARVQGTGMEGRPYYPLPNGSHYQAPQSSYSHQYLPTPYTTAPYYHYPSSSSSFPSSTVAYTSTSLSSSGSDYRYGSGPQSSIPYAPLSSHYSANSSSPYTIAPQSDLMYDRRSNGAPQLNPQYGWMPTSHTAHPHTPQEGTTLLSYSGQSTPTPLALPITRKQTPSPTHAEEKTHYMHPHSASAASSGDFPRPEGAEALAKSLENMHLQVKSDIHDCKPNAAPQHMDSSERTPVASAPVEILEQPRDCEVDCNGQAEFSCKARLGLSDGEPHYLWYKDGEPLVGEISSRCVVEGVTEVDVGLYFCLVSDPLEEHAVKTQHAELRLRQGKGEASCVHELTFTCMIILLFI